MKSIGEILREKREEKDYTIREISSFTNISPNYIKAIEKNEFSALPSETYVIGFIRNYADFLGLNSEEIIKNYKDYMRYEQEVPFEILTKKEPSVKIGTIIKILFITMVILGILTLIIIDNPIKESILSFFKQDQQTPQENIENTEKNTQTNEDNDLNLSVLNSEVNEDSVYQNDVVNIENLIHETLYTMEEGNIQLAVKMNRPVNNYIITYYIDEKEMKQKILERNESLKLIADKRIILKVSDANAIDIGIKNDKNDKIIYGKKHFKNMAGQIAYFEFLYKDETSEVIVNEKGMNIEQIVIPSNSTQ